MDIFTHEYELNILKHEYSMMQARMFIFLSKTIDDNRFLDGDNFFKFLTENYIDNIY